MKLKINIVLISLLAFLLTLTILAPAATAAKTKARPDSAKVTVGARVSVAVLKNDTIGKKPRITITKKSSHVTAKVQGKRIVVKAKKAGKFRINYRVKSSRGTARSYVMVTAKAKKPTVNPYSLVGRLNKLKVASETDGGVDYNRATYKHWNSGLKSDGCDTRREVLIAEARVKPTVGSGCSLTGGEWYSAYDGETIRGYTSTALDMDHMVPLEEAHSSGAWAWSEEKKEAFANDQGDSRSLIGVTPSSNRSKGARDPGEWLPTNAAYHCKYLADWVAVKTRWKLSVDPIEKSSIAQAAKACGKSATTTTISVTVVP